MTVIGLWDFIIVSTENEYKFAMSSASAVAPRSMPSASSSSFVSTLSALLVRTSSNSRRSAAISSACTCITFFTEARSSLSSVREM